MTYNNTDAIVNFASYLLVLGENDVYIQWCWCTNKFAVYHCQISLNIWVSGYRHIGNTLVVRYFPCFTALNTFCILIQSNLNCLLTHINNLHKMKLYFLQPSAPGDPPTEVTAMATNPVSILIQWGHVQCINRNSDITGYTVHYSTGAVQ